MKKYIEVFWYCYWQFGFTISFGSNYAYQRYVCFDLPVIHIQIIFKQWLVPLKNDK